MMLLILEFCASQNSCLVCSFLYVHVFTHRFIHREVGLCLRMGPRARLSELSSTNCVTLGKLLLSASVSSSLKMGLMIELLPKNCWRISVKDTACLLEQYLAHSKKPSIDAVIDI